MEYARWLNDRLAEAVAKHPKRLVALASVPMQDSAKAAAELERAMTKLGLRGAEIASNIGGRYFDDPGFDPFWEAAQALDAVIFVHPNQVVGAERMKEFNLANLIGNPTDTSLAFAKLIFGGVLERFPRLKFLLAHAGGFLPYTWGRLDRGYRIQDSSTAKIPKPPGEYLKLLYFDTITHSRMALGIFGRQLRRRSCVARQRLSLRHGRSRAGGHTGGKPASTARKSTRSPALMLVNSCESAFK